MRFASHALLLLIGLSVLDQSLLVDAKKPFRAPPGRRSPTKSAGPSRTVDRPPRRNAKLDQEEEDDEFDFPLDPEDDEGEVDDEEEEGGPNMTLLKVEKDRYLCSVAWAIIFLPMDSPCRLL